jgi:hypothetical protein
MQEKNQKIYLHISKEGEFLGQKLPKIIQKLY